MHTEVHSTPMASLIEPELHRERLPLLLAMVLFAGLSLWAGAASKGFLEADACTHYMYSRFCFQEHHLLTNVWGRPFCTFLYAIPAALFERAGVRIFTTLLALVIGGITLQIARGQNHRLPALAMIFFLAQPLVFLHSFAELTELPFALLLALAFWAYQRRQWGAMAFVVGLMPTSRPEGFGFVLLAGAALLLHGRKRWLPLLMLPLATWSVAGWIQFQAVPPWYIKSWTWLIENWPYSSTSMYDRGHLLHFAALLPAVVSPFVFPAVLLGLWRSLPLRRWRAFFDDHAARCQMLIAIIPLGVLVVHSLLYWRGRMASNGELRYMLVVAPLWALLAARGWEWAFEKCRLRRPLLWAGVAAVLPIYANRMWQVAPFPMTRDWERARAVADWYRAMPLRETYPMFTSSHTGLYYFLDLSPTNLKRTVPWTQGAVRGEDFGVVTGIPNGVLLVWDPIYGLYNSDDWRTIPISLLLENGWVPIKVFPREHRPYQDTGAISRLAQTIQQDEVGDWVIFLSPRDITGAPTPSSLAVPLPARLTTPTSNPSSP